MEISLKKRLQPHKHKRLLLVAHACMQLSITSSYVERLFFIEERKKNGEKNWRRDYATLVVAEGAFEILKVALQLRHKLLFDGQHLLNNDVGSKNKINDHHDKSPWSALISRCTTVDLPPTHPLGGREMSVRDGNHLQYLNTESNFRKATKKTWGKVRHEANHIRAREKRQANWY